MSSFKEIAGAITDMTEANEIYRDRMEKRIGEIAERVEEIETNGGKPGLTHGSVKESEQRDHVKLFCNWMRRPDDVGRKQALENIEQHLATKAATIATPSSGGYAVPEVLLRKSRNLKRRCRLFAIL